MRKSLSLVITVMFIVATITTLTVACANAQKTTIKVASWITAWKGFMKDAEKDFEKENPNVDLVLEFTPYAQYWQKIPMEVVAGIAPDIMHMPTLQYPRFMQIDGLMNLEPLMEADKEFNWNDYFEFARNEVTYQEKVVALPHNLAQAVLIYNKDFLDEAGVAYPDWSWTWDTLVEAAKKITKDTGKVGQWGFSWNGPSPHSGPILFVYQNNGSILNEEKTKSVLTEAAAIEGIRFAYDRIFKHGVTPKPSDAEGFGDLFEAGRVGLWMTNSWVFGNYQSLRYDWDIAPLPKGKKRASIASIGGSSIGIYGQTKNDPELLWEATKALVTTLAKATGDLPSSRVIAEEFFLKSKSKPESKKVLLDQFPYWVMKEYTLDYLKWRGEMMDELTLIFNGIKSVEEGLADAAAAIDKTLAEEDFRLVGWPKRGKLE